VRDTCDGDSIIESRGTSQSFSHSSECRGATAASNDCLGLADQDSGREDEATADDDLEAGEGKAGLEVPVADECDDNQFDPHDGVGPCERGVDVGDEKWEGMEKSSEEGHKTRDDSAKDGVSPAGEFAVVGETFGESHRNTGTHGGRCTDEKDSTGVMGSERGREDGCEGRDRAVHKTGKPRLNDAQNEVLVVGDNVREFTQIGNGIGHDWVGHPASYG